MTDKEILQKVVEKAEKNGFKYIDAKHKKLSDSVKIGESDYLKITFSINDIIFSHEFAKAFWGENICEVYPSEFRKKGFEARVDKSTMWWNMPLWEYHLQQMILEKEPLRYLEKFL